MKQAVNWLKREKNMLQKDIAEMMGISDVSFSNGMRRLQLKNDEAFVIKFHQATGEIFSLDWLLNGDGDKFAPKEERQLQPPAPAALDMSSYLNALIAKCDETIASLKRELAAKDEVIKAKDERIEDLAAIAEERLHRIAELRRTITSEHLTDYPFPVGAADTHAVK